MEARKLENEIYSAIELRSVPENQISTSEQQAHKADARCDHGNL
jgi:hypothetical protein